jgi:hypothetical protein
MPARGQRIIDRIYITSDDSREARRESMTFGELLLEARSAMFDEQRG